MKKKLLFIHYNPNSTGSFVSRAKHLIRHFSKNYELHILLPGEGPFVDALKEEDIFIHDWKLTENNNLLNYIKAYFKALGFFLKNRFSLIYFMDFVWWKPAEVLAAKTLSLPMIAFIAFYKEKESFRGFLRWMKLFITNSHRTAEIFIENGFEDRTRVVHNFLDLSIFENVQPKREEFLKPAEERLVAYVGVLHPIKGIEYFIDSIPNILQKNSSTRFLIVGGEKSEGIELELKRRVRSLDLEEHVSFLGHRDDISSIMKSLDVLVVPSLEEPFGYINIEAGASGIPVVASRIGGIPEIVKHEYTGLLCNIKRPDQISAGVNLLLGDEELRASLGSNAKKHIEENFSAEIGIKKIDDVFMEVLNA